MSLSDNLQGRIALVTGATGGIGGAIVDNLMQAGIKVIAHGRDRQRLTALSEKYPAITIERADLTDITETENLAKNALKYFGKIDILINNAGIGVYKNVLDMDMAEYGSIMDINMRAVFILCKLIGTSMMRNKSGYIINIGSGASKNAIAGLAVYCASKHALLGFSESLALELRSYGIKVTLLMPGSTATAFAGSEAAERLKSRPGILLPLDIANTVMYLLRQPQRAWTSQVDLRPLDPNQSF